MSTLLTDLRYAFRMLAKSPAFSGIAILALALGIGANTAIFSIVNAVLLRPLPYPHSEQLVIARESTTLLPNGSVSYPNYMDWRAGQHTLTDLALVRRESFNYALPGGDNPPELVTGARISANYFSVFALQPIVGRNLQESDDVPGAAPVALLSESFWRSHFGGAASALGQQIVLDGITREIVGVVPAAAKFPRLAQIWVPFADLRKDKNMLDLDNHPGFSTIGRLKPGVSVQQALADLNTVAAALEQQYPETNTGHRVIMKPLLEYSVGEYRKSLRLLLGAVGCVLLIACANVANLQVARALARMKELAVRSALGASRWSLARQLLTESTLLALLGGAAGMLLATWSLDAIIALTPRNIPRFQETRIDTTALLFTSLVAVGAGILAGIWPAWRISRTDALSVVLHEAGTRGGSGGATRQKARAALVVTQVALAVVLLAGAGLTLKSFWRAQDAPLNFDPHNILLTSLGLPKTRYDNEEKTRAFFDQLLERVRALPGVVAVAIGTNIPFDENDWEVHFHVTGTPAPEAGEAPSAEINLVSLDYFRLMKMPIIRGRGFNANDQAGQTPVVIIDQSFAQKYFHGRDPIGLNIDDPSQEAIDNGGPPLTVVGVVARTRNEAPGEDNVEKMNYVHMYFPFAQKTNRDVTLMVRTAAGDPRVLVGAVKSAVQALDPDQPIGPVSTMDDNIAASLAPRRLTMSLLGAFAGLALLLATVGLYGVMALSVTQRTRELGIRLALGAARADVFRLVLGQGAALIALGVLLGLLGALAAGRALTSVLYGVGAVDFAALITATVALSLVATLACFFPARRATRVDPMIALREE